MSLTNEPGSTTETQKNVKEMKDLNEVVVEDNAASDVHSTPHSTTSSEAAASSIKLINDNLELKKRLMQAKNIIESYSRRLQKYKHERDDPSLISVEMIQKIELEVQEKTNRLLAKERNKVEIEIKQQIEKSNKQQLAEKITQLEVEMTQKNKEANKQLLAREMENIRDVLKKESKIENGRLLAEERSRMETEFQKKFDNDSNMNNEVAAAEKDRESQEMTHKLLLRKKTIDDMTKEHAIAVDALKAEHETSTAANKKLLSMRHLFQKNADITKEHGIEVDMLTAERATALAENKRIKDEFKIEIRTIEQEKEAAVERVAEMVRVEEAAATSRWEERERREREAAEALQKQLQKQEVEMTATMAVSLENQAKKYQDKIEKFEDAAKIAARDAAKATEYMEILQNQLREQLAEKDMKISTLQDCVDTTTKAMEVLKEEYKDQMQVLVEQHEKEKEDTGINHQQFVTQLKEEQTEALVVLEREREEEIATLKVSLLSSMKKTADDFTKATDVLKSEQEDQMLALAEQHEKNKEDTDINHQQVVTQLKEEQTETLVLLEREREEEIATLKDSLLSSMKKSADDFTKFTETLKSEHNENMQALTEQHEKEQEDKDTIHQQVIDQLNKQLTADVHTKELHQSQKDQWMLESQEFQERTKQQHQLELQTVRKQSQRCLDSCVFTHKKNIQLLNEERQQEKTRMLNEIILVRETHEKELMNVETKNQLNKQHMMEVAHLSQKKETDHILSMASHKFLQWQQRMERMRVEHEKEMRKKDGARMEAENYRTSMEAAAIKNVAQLREDIKQERIQETQRIKEETVAAAQRAEEAARMNFLEREIPRYGLTSFLYIPPRQQGEKKSYRHNLPTTEQKGVPKEEEKTKSTRSEVRRAEVFNSLSSKNVADFLYCPATLDD